MRYPGKLIAFEGIDGAGKSTIVKILPEILVPCKVPIITCGEKDSPLADLLKDEKLTDLSSFLKTYLFAIDRAWSYEKCCVPALKKGCLVLWDRYVDSALVYRKVEFGGKESLIDIDFVEQINKPFIKPDLTIIINISVDTSLQRACIHNRLEPYKKEFLEKVKKQYVELGKNPHYILVNGEQARDTVAQDIKNEIIHEFGDIFET